MLRVLLSAYLLCAVAALGMLRDHEEATKEQLNQLEDLVNSLHQNPAEVGRRQLQQSWDQFNNYFAGTYWGRSPGPCNLEATKRTNNRCYARACKMTPSVRAIRVEVPLLGGKRLDEWINCDNCGSYPGEIWLWNTDFGNMHMGGIYLDIINQDANDQQAPPQGFAPTSATQFASEFPYYNQFRMVFTLSEAQFDMDSRCDINKLQIKNLPLISTFTLTRNNIGVVLARNNQPISNNQHGVSFRTTLIFRANRLCQFRSPRSQPTLNQYLDTTCIYRSDKTPREDHYRGKNGATIPTDRRTETFKEGIVYDVNLPRQGAMNSWADNTPLDETQACLWDFSNQYASNNRGAQHTTELGLNLDFGEICNIWPFGDPCRAVVNFLLNLLVGFIIKDLLCQLFTGMFYISNSGGITGTRGVINVALLKLYEKLRGYVETPLSSKADADLNEDVTIPGKFNGGGYDWPTTNCGVTGYCPYPKAVDFNTSDLFRSVSLGLNGILGNYSTTQGYTNKLTIVEVIDILTGNKIGAVKLGLCPPNAPPPTVTQGYPAGTCDGDITDELGLQDYPRFEWTGEPIFDGAVQLNGLYLTGVNSITNLKILDNGFKDGQDTNPEYTHTLKNTFEMTNFGMLMDIWLTLVDGTWVHRPRNQIVPANNKRKIEMKTNVYLELSNIELEVDFFALLRPDLLSDKKIGSIFGNWPDGSLLKRFHCAAFALDYFKLTKLQMSGVLQKLEFQNFAGDLGTVITQGTKVFNLGYKTATATYLKFLADNFIRKKLNEVFEERSYDGPCGTKVNGECTRPDSLDICYTNFPYYFSPTDPNRHINFYDSKVWNLIKGVVNDVVGGIPVRTGSASINTIIDKYLDWYIPGTNGLVVKLPNTNSPAPGERGNFDATNVVLLTADNASSGNAADDKFIEFSNFGVRNLETIHELSIRPTQQSQPRKFRVDFKLGDGKIWDRTNNVYIQNGLFTVKFHLKMEVTESTNGDLVTYTEDEADIALKFGNLTVGTDIYALVNQNEVLDLNFGQLTSAACLMALVDNFNMETLSIGFTKFRLGIDRSGANWRHRDKYCNEPWSVLPCPNPNVQCDFETVLPAWGEACADEPYRKMRMSDAIDHLAWEAQFWGSTVDNMIQYFFNGIAEATRKGINGFFKPDLPIAGCETKSVLSGTPFAFLERFFGNVSADVDDIFSKYQKLTTDQWNPRFPMVNPGDPGNTMYGSRSTGPLAIQYTTSPTPSYPNGFREYCGFPAAKCNRIGADVYLPYTQLNESCWEDKVEIEPTDTKFVDLRESFVVNEAQKFLEKSGRKALIAALDALANTEGNFLGDMLISYPNGATLPDGRGTCLSEVDGEASFCIDLDANLTEVGVKLDLNATREGFIFYNDDFIPGLTIQANRLRVLNLHTFDAEPELFELLKPYIPDQYNPLNTNPLSDDDRDHSARFTLAHRIRFTGTEHLAIQLELDISVEERFLSQTTPTPDRNITDTMTLDFQVKDLDIQMMTMTAINQSRVEEVPFYYFLHPFDKEKCFFSIFYQNGLQVPQFQMYVSDIIGPDAQLKAKSPANIKPNIFSDGMRDVITAGIEMFAQMLREDLPDVTQGSFRSYLNRLLDGYVTSHRNAMGPGSCPLQPACTNPSSYCHYQKFTDVSFDPIFSTLNNVVGGNPIKTSQMDVNALIELGLNYALISPNGPQLVEPGFIEHPKTGDWIVPSILDYTNGDSLVRITNMGLRGLNSIYRLTFDRFTNKPYSLSFDIEAGEGEMVNGTNVPPTEFTSDPLVLQAELEVKVVANRPGNTQETLADNKFRVELVFSGVNVTALQEILFNKTDFYALNFNQITSSQCALSIIDKVTMETILMQIADFDVILPPTCSSPSDTGCFGRNYPDACEGEMCNLGKAIDTLREDAESTNTFEPPFFARPTRMINVVLSQIGDSVVDGFNQIEIWNKPREKCDIPKVILSILAGVDNSTHATQLQDRLMNNVSQVLKVPRPLISPNFKTITVQSTRLKDPVDRPVFIQELIEAARNARGGVPEPEVVLRQSSLCSEMNLPGYAETICEAVIGGQSNFTSKLQEWTRQKRNLIESGVTPSDIEDRVRIDVTKESFYDIRTSKIVKMVSDYFDDKAPVIEELLLSLVNSSRGLLREQEDGGVTLAVNLTEALLYADQNFLSGKTCEGDLKDQDFRFQDLLGTNNFFIPGLRILPGILEISNFGSFSELIILKPYEVGEEKARFTTRHELGWRKESRPLGISVGIELFYDYGFTHDLEIPSGMEEREEINITLTVENLLVQVLTLLAVNTKELGEVRLGDFLNVDVTQEFKRNCKAATCLMKAIFDGGIYMPQFSINVTNIIGPKFTTARKLFSEGMEQFVDAIIEIVVQLFRDDLAAITQGPVRDSINDAMIQMLTDAKKEGACPPRRNYTRDYPLGQFYCSHNDTTGVNPLLTQNEASCRAKGNGRRCKWEPPDGEVTPQTVACFYTQESKVLNFQTSPGLQQLQSFINGSLMNPDSAVYIKNYLGAFASNLSTEPFAEDLNAYPIKYNGQEYGTVRMGIGRFTMVGLDSIDRLQIFDTAPYGPGGDSAFTNGEEYEPAPPNRRLLSASDDSSELEEVSGRRSLAKKVEFGYADNKYMSRTAFGWEELTVGFEVLYAFDELFVPRVDGPQDFVENHIGIKFVLTDFDFVIDLFMLINIPRLMDLQIRSIGTIYELPCILEIFEDNGLIPVHANITYGTVGFRVTCVNRCDSPFFSPLKSGGFSDQTSKSLRESFTEMFQRTTDFAIRLLASSDAQDFLDRQITISNDQCTAIKTGDIFKVPDTGEPHTTNAASAMGIAGLSTLFTSFVVFALLVPLHFRRRDELMKRALLDAHSRGTAGKSKDEFELAERRLRSAFEHPMLPPYVKYGVVVWILINIILFATANFAAAGAIVELTLSIAGDTTYPITLLPFTLERSINDMWMAEVYFLAFVIAIASGGWPYAKNVLLLFSWFAPATVLHPRARGRLLEILDTLGKWSLIDMYVMVLLMVAFRFYISSSYVESFSLLPPDVLVVDVAVTPGWGLYGFVLAAIGTLLVNHVMIWHHRKLVRQDEDLQDAIMGTLVKDLRTPRIPLSRHRFNVLDAEGRPYRYSVMVRVMFVFVLVLSFFILLIGAILPSLKFTFRGIAGIAISLIDEDLGSATHSVVSIGTSLIDGARDTTESVLGILFMQILYILFSLVIPLILCLLLICIWLVPLTLREQLLLYFVAEVLSAWEAVLVLVVSFVACVLQVSQLAQFIVDAATGNLCRALEGQLEKIFPDPEDAQCFNVIAELIPSSSVIIIAGVLIFLASAVTFRLIHAAIIDRELAMRRKPPHSPGEMTGLTGFLVRRSLEAFGASQIQNGGSVANLFAKDQGAFDPRDSQLTASNPILAREMPHSMSSMNTPNPMFHGSMASTSKAAHMSIDV